MQKLKREFYKKEMKGGEYYGKSNWIKGLLIKSRFGLDRIWWWRELIVCLPDLVNVMRASCGGTHVHVVKPFWAAREFWIDTCRKDGRTKVCQGWQMGRQLEDDLQLSNFFFFWKLREQILLKILIVISMLCVVFCLVGMQTLQYLSFFLFFIVNS